MAKKREVSVFLDEFYLRKLEALVGAGRAQSVSEMCRKVIERALDSDPVYQLEPKINSQRR